MGRAERCMNQCRLPDISGCGALGPPHDRGNPRCNLAPASHGRDRRLGDLPTRKGRRRPENQRRWADKHACMPCAAQWNWVFLAASMLHGTGS